MSEGAILAFGVFVGLAFIAVGILGIYRKVKFSKSIQTMPPMGIFLFMSTSGKV